jgi:hypothetical protein
VTVRLDVIKTKTILAASEKGLDDAIADFFRTLKESGEQRLAVHFAAIPTTPPQYAVLIEYTS